MTAIKALLNNPTFWAAFLAWLIAQSIKVLIELVKNKRFDFSVFVRLGGMPSSHSSMACALATSCGKVAGFDGPVFAVALAFAIVVMFDAQSFRRAAGVQAQVLNQMLEELFKEHHLSQKKLVEFLGHTPLEVLSGMMLGIATALAVHALW